MIELKKEVMEVFDNLNKAWIRAVKEGSLPESDGIDLTVVMDEQSKLMTVLDDQWNEGMIRIKGKKGKFW